MTPSLEQLLLVVAVLPFGAVVASKVSARLGIPSLLLFLAIGMLSGSDGPGGGLGGADRHFNLVFFIVIGSVLLQGTTIAPASR